MAWRAELQRKIDAIDVLLEGDGAAKVAGGAANSQATRLPAPSGVVGGKRPKMLIEAVDEATLSLPAGFTSLAVLQYVNAHHPHLKVASTKNIGGPLAKLLKRGKLEYQEAGFGNVPHTYRRKAEAEAGGAGGSRPAVLQPGEIQTLKD